MFTVMSPSHLSRKGRQRPAVVDLPFDPGERFIQPHDASERINRCMVCHRVRETPSHFAASGVVQIPELCLNLALIVPCALEVCISCSSDWRLSCDDAQLTTQGEVPSSMRQRFS